MCYSDKPNEPERPCTGHPGGDQSSTINNGTALSHNTTATDHPQYETDFENISELPAMTDVIDTEGEELKETTPVANDTRVNQNLPSQDPNVILTDVGNKSQPVLRSYNTDISNDSWPYVEAIGDKKWDFDERTGNDLLETVDAVNPRCNSELDNQYNKLLAQEGPSLESPPTFKEFSDPAVDGHSNSVCCCAYSHDGKHLVSGSDDGTIRLWDTASGTLQRTFPAFIKADVCSIALSCTGTGYMAASNKNIAQIWEISTGKKLTLQDNESSHIGKKIVSFSEDGRMLVISGGNNLSVWSVPQFELILQQDEVGFIDSVKFSKDGTLLAVMLRNEKHMRIVIWELKVDIKDGVWNYSMSSKKELHLDTPNDDWANEIAFSPDSKYVAIARGPAQKMCIWNWESETTPKILNENMEKEETVAFSPDGLFLASGSRDKSVKIWRKPWDAEQPDMVLTGHKFGVRGLSFSPTETCLASCSSDGTIRIWDYGSLKAHA